MKTLVLADRRPQIDIRQTAINENAELISSLRDFAREDLSPLADIHNIPKIGIYCNHDSGQYMEELGIMNLHQMIWHYQGKSFAGLQGCVRYKANPYAIMYTQEEVYDILADYPQVDIFITHCPPRGINDEDEIAHQGFDALLQYIDQKPPQVLLHGHTYPEEHNLIRQHGPTRIEYVYGYRIIEL
jgi:Icc-related predicted phosphoesterase